MRPYRAADRRFRARKMRSAGQFLKNQRGASALEFALVVPLLIGLYLGAIEINTALTVYRRTLQVAATAADLTAQVKSVTQGDIEAIQSAAAIILTPYPTAPLKIVLTSVVANDNNVGKVEWSCANTGAARTKNSTFQLPDGLTEPESSVIVAEVSYRLEPLFGPSRFFSTGSYNMERTFYARPRRSLTVKKTDNSC